VWRGADRSARKVLGAELYEAARNVERLIAARADLEAKDHWVRTARRPPRFASSLPPSALAPRAPPNPAARRGVAVGTLGPFWGRGDRSGRGAQKAKSFFSIDRAPPAGVWRWAGGAARAGDHRAAPGQGGYTPLHKAAIKGHVEVAEKLLAAGAAVGATANVCAPLAGEGVAGGIVSASC
jgi:hypothetical protein